MEGEDAEEGDEEEVSVEEKQKEGYRSESERTAHNCHHLCP